MIIKLIEPIIELALKNAPGESLIKSIFKFK